MQLAIPWIEKYRPTKLEDIVGNTHVVERLKKMASSLFLPHCILTGPAGTGKTTSMLCLSNALIQNCFKQQQQQQSAQSTNNNNNSGTTVQLIKMTVNQMVQQCVLSLNASDDRTLDSVRLTIKGFAEKLIPGCPPGMKKMVLLDEADNMTSNAQQALRQIMNRYQESTRFIFICNQPDKLIEGIHSYCATLDYQPIQLEEYRDRVQHILSLEKQKPLSKEALVYLHQATRGDLRSILNELQGICALKTKNIDTNNNFIQVETVRRLVAMPLRSTVQQILVLCSTKQIDPAIQLLAGLHDDVTDIVQWIKVIVTESNDLLNLTKLTDEQRVEWIKQYALLQQRTSSGTLSYLQIQAFLFQCCSYC